MTENVPQLEDNSWIQDFGVSYGHDVPS